MVKSDMGPPFLSCFALVYFGSLAKYPTMAVKWELPPEKAEKIRGYPGLVEILEDHDLAQYLPD